MFSIYQVYKIMKCISNFSRTLINNAFVFALFIFSVSHKSWTGQRTMRVSVNYTLAAMCTGCTRLAAKCPSHRRAPMWLASRTCKAKITLTLPIHPPIRREDTRKTKATRWACSRTAISRNRPTRSILITRSRWSGMGTYTSDVDCNQRKFIIYSIYILQNIH